MRMITAEDGSKIYYNMYGEGKTIVLLHGNFQHHRFFAKQINFFHSTIVLLQWIQEIKGVLRMKQHS